jgi:undecaprenyl-phosphate galactose phosphotransferase
MSFQIGEVQVDYPRFDALRLHSRVSNRPKRMLDILVCVLSAPFALMVGVPIALAIKLDGGPVLYSQRRVGLNGNQFACLKFRSMVFNADERLKHVLEVDPCAREHWARYQKLTHDPRVTWFGRFIRAFSLDELPQLINVWRGEMSIVGPRPITVDQIELYGDQFEIYRTMRPGITGLWQINGRNEKTFAERARLDALYAYNWSTFADLVIMLKTLPVVLAGRGAS